MNVGQDFSTVTEFIHSDIVTNKFKRLILVMCVFNMFCFFFPAKNSEKHLDIFNQ